MEIQGSWCYTRESGAASILGGESSVPWNIPGGVACGSIPGANGFDPRWGAVCSWEDSRWYDVSSYTSGAVIGGGVIDILRLYQVRSSFLFIAGGRILIYTSGLVAMSVLVAGKRLLGDCDGLCMTDGLWVVVWEATHSAAVWSHLSPIQWAAWFSGPRRQLLVGQLLSQPTCLGGQRSAAGGKQSQASLLQRPQPLV